MLHEKDIKRIRVIVIDDNQAIHDDIRKILPAGVNQSSQQLDALSASILGEEANSGVHKYYRVDGATQGREGYNKVQAAIAEDDPYLVAFVDMQMPPGWDGIETIENIWRVDPNIQTVICSAYSDHNWSDFQNRLGETDRLLILKKPFDVVEICQIATALSSKYKLAQDTLLHARHLEERVAKRTEDLTEINAKLHNAMNERRQLETQLLHAQKMESIGQLAAGIAHEINTPMQYVADNTRFIQDSFDGFLKLIDAYSKMMHTGDGRSSLAERSETINELMKKLDIEFLREEVPKAIEQSLEGASRVTEIVSAMKQFSHPGQEGKSTADLNELIRSTATVCRNRWKYVADLELTLDENLPAVFCYASEFNQVILNLVVNAADAIAERVGESGNKGRIDVRTYRDGVHAVIEVEDNGGGIPENIRGKVFDPFFTTKGVGKGTGQGLAISHDIIVNKHSGTIELETEAGKGTRFKVRLPIGHVGGATEVAPVYAQGASS